MAFKGGVVLGTVSLNATGAGTTNIGGTSNSGTISIGNGSSGAVAINCGTAGITVGTTANAHTSTFGSTNTTSATTIQSGTGALNVTSTNGALTVNSGTGALGISTDASATTVSFATGAAAKTVTLGSTNTTSSLALHYGTADFTLASATGTVMSALDSGEITMPLQPAFQAYLASADANVTGNGTAYALGSVTALTEDFDQGGDLASNGVFTAPVDGKYRFTYAVLLQQCATATNADVTIVTSNYTIRGVQVNPSAVNVSGSWGFQFSCFVNMDAGDTAIAQFNASGVGADTCDVFGSAGDRRTWFSGNLEV